MADDKKKNLGLKGISNLPQKVALRQNEISEEKTEKIVKQIHSTQGKVTRLSIDVPEEMYTPLKIRQLKKGFKTTREYILSLIQQDLDSDTSK